MGIFGGYRKNLCNIFKGIFKHFSKRIPPNISSNIKEKFCGNPCKNFQMNLRKVFEKNT